MYPLIDREQSSENESFGRSLPARSTRHLAILFLIHAKEFKLDFKNDLYEHANRLTAETRQALTHELNLRYREDSKQRLDLYFPKQSSGKAQVLLFLHGGGFIEGDRPHYGFIARPFAAQRIITAVASYRLSCTISSDWTHLVFRDRTHLTS